MRAIVFLGLAGLMMTGCTRLECDPEAMEVDGMCVCRAGFMPVGDRCESTTDTGMNDSGPDTGDTDAGADAPMACGGACMGATPHCDTDTDTCVACLDNTHCDESAPVCGAGGVCGPCTGPTDCSAYPDAPVCGDSGAVDGMCVACVGDSDCTDADAGKCDTGTNTCVPCDDSDQCTEDGAGICDMSGESGVCVECTIDTEETACGEFSCNPATNECTETERTMTPRCGACAADSECIADHFCVPMNFAAAPHGSYCLPPVPGGACPQGFRVVLEDRLSASGNMDSYCGIDEVNVTCEAVRALGVDCSESACPTGGRCETEAGLGTFCTYSCGSFINCPQGAPTDTCDGGYCGS
jgi:hypothetical protein